MIQSRCLLIYVAGRTYRGCDDSEIERDRMVTMMIRWNTYFPHSKLINQSERCIYHLNTLIIIRLSVVVFAMQLWTPWLQQNWQTGN